MNVKALIHFHMTKREIHVVMTHCLQHWRQMQERLNNILCSLKTQTEKQGLLRLVISRLGSKTATITFVVTFHKKSTGFSHKWHNSLHVHPLLKSNPFMGFTETKKLFVRRNKSCYSWRTRFSRRVNFTCKQKCSQEVSQRRQTNPQGQGRVKPAKS